MILQNVLIVFSFFASSTAAQHDMALVHPGALHSSGDITRVRNHVHARSQPWYRAWQHLESGVLAQTSWVPTPQVVLVRGSNATFEPTPPENYPYAYRDAHSAYQLTLRWLVGGNNSYADHAVEILNGWGSKLRDINGTEDKFLAAGLYGYQFANAAEILRLYPGWTKENQTIFGDMLTNVFAKYNLAFLKYHNYKANFYYANWDLCNIASLMAIGIFNDNQTMLSYATHYWKYGPPGGVVANGALPFFSIANFTEERSGKTLMEIQESGRDQGHATLCIALLGIIGQQAWNQGIDLYSTYGNEILNGAEYVAKYNTNHSVSYQPYTSWEGLLPVVSETDRFTIRPGYEAISSHYAGLRHMSASWSKKYRDYVNRNISADIEGGGGDYGPLSSGYDVFGHGTLMYRILPDN